MHIVTRIVHDVCMCCYACCQSFLRVIPMMEGFNCVSALAMRVTRISVFIIQVINVALF